MRLISELPADIRAVAEQRRKEQGKSEISHTFDWAKTPEGYPIWLEVALGNYQPFRDFHAKNEETTPGHFKKFSLLDDSTPTQTSNNTKDIIETESKQPTLGELFERLVASDRVRLVDVLYRKHAKSQIVVRFIDGKVFDDECDRKATLFNTLTAAVEHLDGLEGKE